MKSWLRMVGFFFTDKGDAESSHTMLTCVGELFCPKEVKEGKELVKTKKGKSKKVTVTKARVKSAARKQPAGTTDGSNETIDLENISAEIVKNALQSAFIAQAERIISAFTKECPQENEFIRKSNINHSENLFGSHEVRVDVSEPDLKLLFDGSIPKLKGVVLCYCAKREICGYFRTPNKIQSKVLSQNPAEELVTCWTLPNFNRHLLSHVKQHSINNIGDDIGNDIGDNIGKKFISVLFK